MSVIRWGYGGSRAYIYMIETTPPRWHCCACYLSLHEIVRGRIGIILHMFRHKLATPTRFPLIRCVRRVLPGRET